MLIIGLGWGGLAPAFVVIVLGAIAIGATSRIPGVLLIAASLGGVFFGGTFVALFMALSLVGGVLAAFGAAPSPTKPLQSVCTLTGEGATDGIDQKGTT